MIALPRVQVVEVVSGQTVLLPEEGMSVGGPGADLEVVDADGILAFIDPTDGGFIITDAGLDAAQVNDSPVIGQRFAQLGDRFSLGGRAFRLEPAAVLAAPAVEHEAEAAALEGDTLPPDPLDGETLEVTPSETSAAIVSPQPWAGRGNAPQPQPQPEPESERSASGADALPSALPSSLRTALGWLLVTVVVAGSAAAGYFVAAMLRGGR
ncbi:MAG: hypothetical protein RL625_344 [Gemmatimonadota bacterium]